MIQLDNTLQGPYQFQLRGHSSLHSPEKFKEKFSELIKKKQLFLNYLNGFQKFFNFFFQIRLFAKQILKNGNNVNYSSFAKIVQYTYSTVHVQ